MIWDFLTIFFAGLALIVSTLSYSESRKTRIEHGCSYLTFELMRINNQMYLFFSNIGNIFAYDVNITMSEPFVNVFENLKIIRPGCIYRYCLMSNKRL